MLRKHSFFTGWVNAHGRQPWQPLVLIAQREIFDGS
jgi:hypothetical protein